MKKLLISALLATTSATLMLSPAIAVPAAPTTLNKADFSDKMMKRFDGLNLSDTQKAQIKTIMQSQHSQTDLTQMRAEREQSKQKIEALTSATKLDTRTLNALADAEAQKAKQRFINRVQTQHAINQVLTANQREKLAAIKAERKAQHQNYGPRGKGPGMNWAQK